MISSTRVCNCIGLHDFKLEGIKWKEWFDYTLSLFTKHNLEPMRLGVQGVHYGDSVKAMSYKGGKKKLEKFNFEGIHNLCFMVMEDKDDYNANFIISSSVHPHLRYAQKSTADFCIDEKLEYFDNEKFEDIIAKIFDFTEAKYGYYYKRMLKYFPTLYTQGGNSPYPNPEDKRRCDIWKYEALKCDRGVYIGPYKTGDLRDIYKLNFLSREHLIRDTRPSDQHSSGIPITLEAWINSNPNHGDLKQLREGFWSWYVPDEQIESVRNSLIPSGIILCV